MNRIQWRIKNGLHPELELRTKIKQYQLAGLTQGQIAVKLHVSQPRVAFIVGKIKKEMIVDGNPFMILLEKKKAEAQNAENNTH